MKDINELNILVKNCTDCGLHKVRNNTVPGSGSLEAEIMFIGEGPGYHEDRLGFPFSGPSGEYLDELLLGIGLARHIVFLANMLKCRAPDNRDPRPDEMQSCSKYLDRQIELINPKLIVTLGKFSTGKFITFKKISDVRGKVIKKDGRFILPILHPAAGLHNPAWKEIIKEDFLKIPQIMKLPRPEIILETKQMSLL